MAEGRKRKLHIPGHFGSLAAALAFRDRLLREVRAGRMKESRYRSRVKDLVRVYDYESRMVAMGGGKADAYQPIELGEMLKDTQ